MLVYLTLAAGMLLAWLPLFGRSLPFSDDFDFMSVISEGGIPGYLRWLGFFRPLGQYLPVWLFLENRGFHPILVLSTHLISGILLFHVCRSLSDPIHHLGQVPAKTCLDISMISRLV